MLGSRGSQNARTSSREEVERLRRYDWPGWVRWGHLVTPENVRAMSERQFVGRIRDDGTPPPDDAQVWEQLQLALRHHERPADRRRLHEWVELEHDMIKQVAKLRRVYEEALG